MKNLFAAASSLNPDSALWSVFLTHRRGGAVLILDGSSRDSVEFAAGFLRTIQNYDLSQMPANLTKRTDFKLFAKNGVAFAVAKEKTAEVLADMYRACLDAWHLEDLKKSDLRMSDLRMSDLKMTVTSWGCGPGSFTGLRLGAAFCNGLNKGRKRTLVQFPCPALIEGQDPADFELETQDMIVALETLGRGDLEVVQEMSPAYGREPGPVIKLREENNGR